MGQAEIFTGQAPALKPQTEALDRADSGQWGVDDAGIPAQLSENFRADPNGVA